jgi:hypothetical protein
MAARKWGVGGRGGEVRERERESERGREPYLRIAYSVMNSWLSLMKLAP